MIYDFELLSDTAILGNMFFASTIFITLTITRYSNLDKLILDSRDEIEKGVVKFINQDEYSSHITNYKDRLIMLQKILFLSCSGGVCICTCFVMVIFKLQIAAVLFFTACIILFVLSLVLLVIEISLLFRALNEHLSIMRILRHKLFK